METSIRTIYGAYLQTCQLLNMPVVVSPHSTLNEKFNINAGLMLAETDIPRVAYVGIGDGGHTMTVGANNVPYPVAYTHTPRDAALFNQVPFILREPANDLTQVERMNYRLRRIEQHDGKPYVAYYLKKLDLSNTVPTMDYRTVKDGSIFSQVFTPAISDLNPTPQVASNTGVVTTTGDYIAVTAKVVFNMTESDIAEYLNVANILYGDSNRAMISEIAFCSGVDRNVVGDFNGISSGYTDVVAAQITHFMSVFYAMRFNNAGVNLVLDVGALEAMLVLGS